MKKRIAIFASGSGTNMENIAKRVKAGELECEIALLVCDCPGARVIERAVQYGIEIFTIERKNFPLKEAFETAINDRLIEKKIEAIFLAGYMKILGPALVRGWKWRILNIHPSLLPKFPGAHAIQDAFQAKEKETGVTVHFVDEGVDTGPVILQRRVQIFPEDSLETLEARVHAAEYELYPEAIRLFLSGRLKVAANRVLAD